MLVKVYFRNKKKEGNKLCDCCFYVCRAVVRQKLLRILRVSIPFHCKTSGGALGANATLVCFSLSPILLSFFLSFSYFFSFLLSFIFGCLLPNELVDTS